MIHFDSDYTEGCIPQILDALQQTNHQQTSGYGVDPFCQDAKIKIQDAFANHDMDVHFLVGGTQTNVTVISSILKRHQGAICADSGHINDHETGALELCGYKCLALPSKQGKITAQQVDSYIKNHYASSVSEHTVQPGLVYISFPTESGTLYSYQELHDLYQVCQAHQVPLFIDGARLGYGLMAKQNDIAITDFAKLCDVFYIGGTKIGALFGEAVCIINPAYKKDFRYHIKQHGGLLAKGRLLGIQFQQLFTNNTYFSISQHAINQANKIEQVLKEKGYSFYFEAQTNQLFPIVSKKQLAKISQEIVYTPWTSLDDEYEVIRLVTSFMTTDQQVETLLSYF